MQNVEYKVSIMQNATTKWYFKPINSNVHLRQFLSASNICVIAHKNKREDFRQLALFLFA